VLAGSCEVKVRTIERPIVSYRRRELVHVCVKSTTMAKHAMNEKALVGLQNFVTVTLDGFPVSVDRV
jgi:hypothetical protein